MILQYIFDTLYINIGLFGGYNFDNTLSYPSNVVMTSDNSNPNINR